MQMSANLVWPGNQLMIGQTPHEVEAVAQRGGLVVIQYRNAKGILKEKTVPANKKVNVK